MKKICFVCVGNTCRSPMAEKIFNDMAKNKGIKGVKAYSAGISCPDGENMEIKAKRALKKLGYNCGAKKSSRVKQIEKNVLYITMTQEIRQSFNSGKVISFYDLFKLNISDPYGKSQEVYDQTAVQIENCIKVLVEKIQKII